MKRIFFAILLLLSLSMMFLSCSKDSNNVNDAKESKNGIDGYWVGVNSDDNSYSYLYCDGDKVYWLSGEVPKQLKQRKADYDEVKALFQNRDTSEYLLRIGRSMELYLPDDLIVNKLKEEQRAVSDEFKAFLNTAGPSSEKYECVATQFSEPDESASLVYDKANNIPKLYVYNGEVDYEFTDEPDQMVVSFERINPAPVEASAKDTKGTKEKKEKKGVVAKIKNSTWSGVFDEKGIAAFNTGLTTSDTWGQSFIAYLYLYAYSYSEDSTEGTASIAYYQIRGGNNVSTPLMNCEYKYKDGVLYLKRGMFENRTNWLPLRVHEMPLTYNVTEKKLSGKIWLDNLHSYSVDAKLERVNYSNYGNWSNVIF